MMVVVISILTSLVATRLTVVLADVDVIECVTNCVQVSRINVNVMPSLAKLVGQMEMCA